jgi:hypothetical protein
MKSKYLIGTFVLFTAMLGLSTFFKLTPSKQRRRTMTIHKRVLSVSAGALISILAGPALADCSGLPSWQALRNALVSVVSAGGNGGLGFNMWGSIVANDGTVCAVAFSGSAYTSQWLGSRAIAAQKATTANDYSLGGNSMPAGSAFPKGLALSTGNLFTAVQPGGSLYGLQHSNPIDTAVLYGNSGGANDQGGPADPRTFGTKKDPMVGLRVGGGNVFGGGLALFQQGLKVGGLGVSGDTSCTDHMVAWKVRHVLGYDQLQGVAGVSGDSARPDNIIFDISPNNPSGDGGTGQNPAGNGGVGQSDSGFGHPKCLNNPDPSTLPAVQ